MPFKEVPPQVDFPALERRILQWWAETGAFKKRVELNRGKPKWRFIDGPITANNPMGVHHAWGRSYKDLWHRFKAMTSHEIRYQNGFDGQGLWIEVEVEKELGFKSKRDIEVYGIAQFVEKCKARVVKFAAVQTEQSKRLGYWMDWDNSYHTMSDENNYTIWYFLKKCHQSGLIYKGHDSVPWCPRCGTAISQHEILQEEYQPLTHKSVVVKFPTGAREYFLAWTTTPWSIPGTIALMVNPDFDYVKVKQEDGEYILASEKLSTLKGPFEIIERFKGKELIGRNFVHPYQKVPALKGQKFPVIPSEEFVTLDIGTAIVTNNPGVGHEDYVAAKKVNLEPVDSIDEAANFLPGYGWLSGKNSQDKGVTDELLMDLKERGFVHDIYDFTHRYPVCWRCKTSLVFRLVDEWFISMQELRYQIMEVARKIRWIPEFGLERELDWLRNMADWMVSKKRYWGLALPIYECSHGHVEVIGSEAELKERAVEGWEQFEGHSPHRPWVDTVKIRLRECGEVVSRIPDVGNPWLDAGIVPFSTLNYRHQRDYWSQWFPADFITESFPGQYRNWFYALLVMSTVLENAPPFLTILGHATVRDEKGEEMHKSKGNLILFDEAAERAGADVMRWMYALQKPEQNLNFGFGVADEVRRRFFIPLWNVYSFFVTYANIDGWTPSRAPSAQRPAASDLDRWILSRLHGTVKLATESLEDYDAATASRQIEAFVDDLSNWYVRRSRRRFWKSEHDQDKQAAYATLYECLVTTTQLLAPFVPFLSEELYQNLVRSVNPPARESVHHSDWPQTEPSLIDAELEAQVALLRRIASLGHTARNAAHLKVRQPLREARIVLRDSDERRALEALGDQLADELNVKTWAVVDDAAANLRYRVVGDLATLGPKHGDLLPKIQASLENLDAKKVAALRRGEQVKVRAGRAWVSVFPDEVEIEAVAPEGWALVEQGGYAVLLSTELDEALRREGLAREVVRRIQDLRKKADLRIEEKITTYYQADAQLAAAIEEHAEYVRRETLSLALVRGPAPEGSPHERVRFDGHELVLGLQRDG